MIIEIGCTNFLSTIIKSKMKFREANINDHLVIAGFQQKMAYETEHIHLKTETVTAGVKSVFDNPGKGKYYVVDDNGKVVSSLLTTYEWSDWRNSWVIWIQSVFVLPEYRKKGVFRMMYEEIKKIVDTNSDYSGIRLYVDRTNEKAIQTYEAIGMHGEHYRLFEDMKF
jgi:ribosomal protein S18 acetylase RimI-like enzyme